MSSGTPRPLEVQIETCVNHNNSIDVTNGDPLMTSEDNNNTTCDHRVGDLKRHDQDGHKTINTNVSKKPRCSEIADPNRIDAPKKSLSFFPSVEDSGESLDNSDAEEFSPEKVSADESKSNVDHKEVNLGHKSAVPIESDHDDASSTSSCSCEDHSSVGGQSDDGGHGDLDYDDDSITNSPIERHGRLARKVDSSEPSCSSIKDTTNQHHGQSGKLGKSNGLRVHLHGEHQGGPEVDPSQLDVQNDRGSRRPTKIRSFINYNRVNDEKNDDSTATKPHKDRSHKSYEGMLKYFFKDACYFQIKSINHENVEISKSMGVWSTPMQNETRLNTAFREHRNVILIFSVQQSGAFQGFARMTSESRPAGRPVPWVLPERLSNASLGGVFQVQWLCAKELNFNETRDLHNPFNNDKPVKVARDGQQVEPKVGKKLCLLFPRDSKKRLLSCLEKLKAQTRQRKQLSQKRNSYYPLSDTRSYNPAAPNRHNINFAPQPTVFNGYEDVSISTSSQNHLYPSPHDYIDLRIPPRRRGPEHMAPGHYVRRRPYPSQNAPSYHGRSSHYNQIGIGDTSPNFNHGFPNIPQAEFYPDHYGQHHQYPGPIPPPAMAQSHSRSYYDWNMAAPSPVRYHPYQRPRR